MGDQHRWFKLWCSAPHDDALQSLNPGIRWAWAALGCYTKVHGTHGVVLVSSTNAALAAEMGVPAEQLMSVIKLLPHIAIERVENRDGENIVTLKVTWHNWLKYQEDSTAAERNKKHRALRSKRRGEEKRKETPLTLPADAGSESPPSFVVPTSIMLALKRCATLGAVVALSKPKFWQAQVRAYPAVDFPRELLAAEAWLAANPGRGPRKDFPRFVSSWLRRASSDLEAEA